MTTRRFAVALFGIVAVFTLAACRSETATAPTAVVDTTMAETQGSTADGVVAVAFDVPGADPRPLREVSVAIVEQVPALRMKVTDLSYRGVVCGFTFAGVRPPSPLTISVEGTIATGVFSSGPADVSWTADGVVNAAAPASNNGWSFSADAYPSRNGPGWAVSIGAVTGEGDNVIPSSVTCELRSPSGLVAANGPVGYWAGFATR
jgi:hypothetical protein